MEHFDWLEDIMIEDEEEELFREAPELPADFMTKLGVTGLQEEGVLEEGGDLAGCGGDVWCMMGEVCKVLVAAEVVVVVFSLQESFSMLVTLVMVLLVEKFCICDRVLGCCWLPLPLLGRYLMHLLPSEVILAMPPPLVVLMMPLRPAKARMTPSGFRLF